MNCLKRSYKLACLQCSFTDKELGEFIQFKKQHSELQKKKAVELIGLQPDGSWVLASDVCLSSEGKMINISENQYLWISDLFSGPGIPSSSERCTIELSLNSDPLRYLNSLLIHMDHNFMPLVLTISSVILALHYQTMIKRLKFCPIPLAFGESRTGKTTALLSGLSLLGH